MGLSRKVIYSTDATHKKPKKKTKMAAARPGFGVVLLMAVCRDGVQQRVGRGADHKLPGFIHESACW